MLCLTYRQDTLAAFIHGHMDVCRVMHLHVTNGVAETLHCHSSSKTQNANLIQAGLVVLAEDSRRMLCFQTCMAGCQCVCQVYMWHTTYLEHCLCVVTTSAEPKGEGRPVL